MKVENIREVKTRFSRYVKELPKSGTVLITKNGRPCAALVPVTEDTDLEALALSQNEHIWTRPASEASLLEAHRRRDRAREKRGLRRSGRPLRRRIAPVSCFSANVPPPPRWEVSGNFGDWRYRKRSRRCCSPARSA
jgi:prevent-host-death family protein